MNDERRHWLDEPANVNRLFWVLAAVCGALAIADLLIHRHGHFAFEEVPTFFCAVGFLAFFLIVLAGRALRHILQRDEDYYDAD
jgi:hypothetical protein